MITRPRATYGRPPREERDYLITSIDYMRSTPASSRFARPRPGLYSLLLRRATLIAQFISARRADAAAAARRTPRRRVALSRQRRRHCSSYFSPILHRLDGRRRDDTMPSMPLRTPRALRIIGFMAFRQGAVKNGRAANAQQHRHASTAQKACKR